MAEKADLELLLFSELFESVQKKLRVQRDTLAEQFGVRGMRESGAFVKAIIDLELTGLRDMLNGMLDTLIKVYFRSNAPRTEHDEAFLLGRLKDLYAHRLRASRTSLESYFSSPRCASAIPGFEWEASSVFHDLLRKVSIMILENRINNPALPDREASELLTSEENDQLEFKATFQYDMEKRAKNVDLRFAVIKTIAAFNNTSGGYLLIGVSDDKKILGIDNDLSLLSRQNLDGFTQALTQEIENKLSTSFIPKTAISFPVIEDMTICLIKINIGDEPIWANANNQDRFFIRTQNSTRELDPKEAAEYSLKKWGRKG